LGGISTLWLLLWGRCIWLLLLLLEEEEGGRQDEEDVFLALGVIMTKTEIKFHILLFTLH
jgi:hypothetical protein